MGVTDLIKQPPNISTDLFGVILKTNTVMKYFLFLIALVACTPQTDNSDRVDEYIHDVHELKKMRHYNDSMLVVNDALAAQTWWQLYKIAYMKGYIHGQDGKFDNHPSGIFDLLHADSVSIFKGQSPTTL